MTLDAFLSWEERQLDRHDFRAGVVVAFAGTSDTHNQIATNLTLAIEPALGEGPCRLYVGDVALVTAYPSSRYPDVFVTCDERDTNDSMRKRHPKLIVEILSSSTAAVDANEKLDEYETIPTLEEYALVDSRRVSVRMFRRVGHQLVTDPLIITGSLELRSIGTMVPLATIYRKIVFDRP